MTKSELKTGMIVTYRNGKRRKVFLNTCLGKDFVSGEDGWMSLDFFNEDLTFNGTDTMDIVKVESLFLESDFTRENPCDPKVIWRRPVPKKRYTYAQLKEILGEEFEIVKE